MMNNENGAKRTKKVILSHSSSEILEGWRVQIANSIPGCHISAGRFIEWSLSQAPTLSRSQVEELRKRFFDEIKQLEWMLNQAKIAKRSGASFEVPRFPQKKKRSLAKKMEGDQCLSESN